MQRSLCFGQGIIGAEASAEEEGGATVTRGRGQAGKERGGGGDKSCCRRESAEGSGCCWTARGAGWRGGTLCSGVVSGDDGNVIEGRYISTTVRMSRARVCGPLG